MNVIAIANHKGGVGKTTTTLNLGCTLAELGQRVLLVDLDPQANTTEGLGCEHCTPRLEDILTGPTRQRLSDCAVHFGSELRARADGDKERRLLVADRLWLLPTSLALVQAQDALIATGPRYPFALRDMLRENAADFDVVLIDAPGVGATMWTNLALLAAQWVIAPAGASDYDVRAAAKQSAFVRTYMGQANPDLKLLGVLITMHDRRWILGRAAERALQGAGLPRIPISIPADNRGSGIKAALRERKPFYFIEPDGRPIDAYRRVARHVLDVIGTPCAP